MTKKKLCPITRSEFAVEATDIRIDIGELVIDAVAKEFSTGSLGWHANGKTTIMVGDKRVPVSYNILITVVNSKESS